MTDEELIALVDRLPNGTPCRTCNGTGQKLTEACSEECSEAHEKKCLGAGATHAP